MAEIIVEAQSRAEFGKNANRRLRVAGRIPAVMYGGARDAVAMSVTPGAIQSVLYADAGQNTIFSLELDGEVQANAMVKEYQLDPVKGNLIHADLMAINMDQELFLTVAIEIVGEAVGVTLDAGTMDVVTREVEVQCLPADIPESIKVDVSELQINQYIRVKNIEVNPKVKMLTDPELVLVTVLPPVKEEEVVEEAAPEETAAEPEVIKKGKAEEGEEDKPAEPS